MTALGLPSLSKWLEGKTPRQKWLLLFNFTNFASNSIGLRTLTDGRIYWWSYSSGVLLGTYAILLPYSIVYSICTGNVASGLNACCASGLVVSVILRFFG